MFNTHKGKKHLILLQGKKLYLKCKKSKAQNGNGVKHNFVVGRSGTLHLIARLKHMLCYYSKCR